MIDETKISAWPTTEVTVGLPADHDWTNIGQNTEPLKMVIPQSPEIVQKGLRRKGKGDCDTQTVLVGFAAGSAHNSPRWT